MQNCKNCGQDVAINTPYYKGKMFCGSSCAATHNNRLHPKRPKTFGPVNCLYCGTPVNKVKTSKYCNSVCSGAHRTLLVIERWTADPSTGTAKNGGLLRPLRTYLMDQAGNKCTLCGWGEKNPVTNSVPLEVNHIDGDAFNNSPDNLQIVCPNCHSLTPNFRALNKSATRIYRKTK